MKINKTLISGLVILSVLACGKFDEVVPSGGTYTEDQLKSTYELIPSRTDASFTGLFSMMGEPNFIFKRSTSTRADDFGFIMAAFSNDIEAADVVLDNNDYNWFSVCGEYTSRNADYANPYIRYAIAYNQIKVANDIINSFDAATTDTESKNKLGQAHAMRAFDYLYLAPAFQFTYLAAKDQPCVPIVTEKTTDFANNPRATVEKVYELIIEDLNAAEKLLGGSDIPSRTNKSRIDLSVVYGLRARANLVMGKWEEAAEDAGKALEGYTPASIEEVSQPTFKDISEHNWIWGIDMVSSAINAQPDGYYATSSSWIRSFSGDGYSAGTATYARINNILYDLIPDTDVRKGWWVDKNLESPLLEKVTWNGTSGKALAQLTIENVKEPFTPYTNVKFGMAQVGESVNDDDFPLMRAEEMILIRVEALYRAGSESEAKTLLKDFITTYRDPSYTVPSESERTFLNEVWFQRRVELWGEGFGMSDIMRLQKNVVRFHEGKESIVPEAFRFNIAYNDPWLLMRFCTSETNTNFGIQDNTGGEQPVSGQNGELNDGVTD